MTSAMIFQSLLLFAFGMVSYTAHALASVSTAAEEQSWAKVIPLPPSGSMGQQFSSLLDNKQLDVVSYTSVQAGTLGQDA